MWGRFAEVGFCSITAKPGVQFRLIGRLPISIGKGRDVPEEQIIAFSAGKLTRRWHPMTVKRAVAATA